MASAMFVIGIAIVAATVFITAAWWMRRPVAAVANAEQYDDL
jgi:uncharacterized iron-regulated membrane protein